MGCNSDYLEPTAREYELSRAARLYAYALETLGREVPDDVLKASQEMYCRRDFVAQLCDLISSLDEVSLDNVVYNARDKMARDLANWWESHQEADSLRQSKTLASQLKQIVAVHINDALGEATKNQRAVAEEQARLIELVDLFVDEKLTQQLTLAASMKSSYNIQFQAENNYFALNLNDAFWDNPVMVFGISHKDYRDVLDIESMSLSDAGVQFNKVIVKPVYEHFWFRLREFAKSNGFRNLSLTYAHDGVGTKCWSVFILEL